MQEQLSEILYFIKGALKYKWTALIMTWVLSICGWTYVSMMP